jgi:hypothetical protein
MMGNMQTKGSNKGKKEKAKIYKADGLGREVMKKVLGRRTGPGGRAKSFGC